MYFFISLTAHIGLVRIILLCGFNLQTFLVPFEALTKRKEKLKVGKTLAGELQETPLFLFMCKLNYLESLTCLTRISYLNNPQRI